MPIILTYGRERQGNQRFKAIYKLPNVFGDNLGYTRLY